MAACAPHTDRCVVNPPFGQATQFVVDRVLLTKKALPHGVWSFEYVDGFAAVVDISCEDGKSFLLEDLFPQQL